MCTSIVCPCSSVHATDYLWLPSWHRLRSCIDIGVALSWHRLRIILTSASRYSWHRLRINSNNPSNPTYLSSAELPNSLWHRLRIILTSASHSAWHRLRINTNNPWNPTYLISAELPNSLWHRLRSILTSASHSSWHRLRIIWNLFQNDIESTNKIMPSWPPKSFKQLSTIIPKSVQITFSLTSASHSLWN